MIELVFSLIISNSFAAGQNSIIKKLNIDIKNPLELRDPFKRKMRKISMTGESRGRLLVNDKFTNHPSLAGRNIENIRVVGVLLGQTRRAIARLVDESGTYKNETYFIKEGMKLGQNGAVVKAIVPGGIILAEKIRNVYEEDEYIETVIPITTPPPSKK